MRPVLTLCVLVACAGAACAPRPHPYPVAEAPYLLSVPAPGSDYRYRTGPQGFGRTGPVGAPGVRAPLPPIPYGPPPYHGPGPEYGAVEHGGRWGHARHSVRGGYSYESRETATEERYFEGGVIVERQAPPAPRSYPDARNDHAYPGPYAEYPGDAPRAFEAPPRRPYPEPGPEAFY